MALDVLTAAIRIASLFPDDGATVLADAGLPRTWEAVLEAAPESVRATDNVPPAAQGERLLVLLREHLNQDLRAAVAITRALFRRRSMELGADHPDALSELGALGALADRAGRQHEASDMLHKAYIGLRSVAGGRDMRLAVVAHNLGWHHLRLDQPLRAEQYLDQALRIRREIAPDTTGPVAAQLGELLVRRGEVEGAIPLLQEAWERYRDAFGPTDPRSVARAKTLAAILTGLDRDQEAVPVLRVVYQTAPDPEQRAAAGFQLGTALEAMGKKEEAVRLVEEAIRWTRSASGEEPHPELAHRLVTWAHMQLRRRRAAEAESLILEAIEAERVAFGEGSPEVAMRLASLGHLYSQMGRNAEAMGFLEPAASILVNELGPEDPSTRFAVEVLVGLWVEEGKALLARRETYVAKQVLAKAVGVARPVLGLRHYLVVEIEKLGVV